MELVMVNVAGRLSVKIRTLIDVVFILLSRQSILRIILGCLAIKDAHTGDWQQPQGLIAR